MKKYSIFLLPVVMIIFLSNNYPQKKKHIPVPEAISKWTGTMTSETIIIYSNAAYNGRVEIHGNASFTDALPTLFRDDETTDLNFTDDKGPGHHKVHSEITDIVNKKCVADCEGNGQAELHSVVINEETNSYDIDVIFPTCVGTAGCSEDGKYIADDLSATVSSHPLGNKDVLSGTKTVTSEIIGGLGTVTRTITWHLVRSRPVDVELIVTPVDYVNWKPEPGKDELMKGTVMTIDLKLQGKNGKPLNVKAESFELRLSNTSKEPGITINYPLSPRANQLPDLRFLLLPGTESTDEDQFMTVGSPDGSTGKAWIGSYDGGGWATLTVEAVLEDKRHIKGQLLVSGGDEDILIPKRTPGNKIALAWAKAYGNPQDLDDKERKTGNPNIGDGLTAYEEYRGVISEGGFKRLKPDKKELGLLIKREEKKLFEDGFARFSKASDIETILFDKYEIPDNRRLNQNTSYGRDFKQFVLRINKGNTGVKDLYGFVMNAFGVAYPNVNIPARVTHITIDVDRIHKYYMAMVQINGAANLPFTDKDMVANTTAHEIGHGVNLPHHGNPIPPLPSVTAQGNPPQVFEADRTGSWEITDRPYTIDGPIGLPGNNECGNVSCFMCYRNKSFWVRVAKNNFIFYYVPLMEVGSIFCTDKTGTGINTGNNYFGNAINGECLNNIKLRD